MDADSELPNQSHRNCGDAADNASAEPALMSDAATAGGSRDDTGGTADDTNGHPPMEMTDPQSGQGYMLQQQGAQEQHGLGQMHYAEPAGEEVICVPASW